MQIFTNFINGHMSRSGLFLKFDCEFSRWVESNNDLIELYELMVVNFLIINFC